MKRTVLLLSLFLPLMSFAQPTQLCGRVSYGDSSRSSVDLEGSGYQVRVDCSRNPERQLSGRDPLAVIQEISPAHKGWITRFTQSEVAKAAKAGDPNPRNAVPYVCMDVEINEDPCETRARRVSIEKIYEMHGTPNTIKSYLKK